MTLRVSRIGGVLVGSILVAIGAGTAALYGFANQYYHIYAGLLLFTVGYELINYTTTAEHLWGAEKLRDLVHGVASDPVPVISVLVLIGAGVGSMAEGIRLFSQLILASEPSVTATVLSGVMSFGGYVVAHIGVNQSVI